MRIRFMIAFFAAVLVVAVATPAGAQNGLDMVPSDAAGVVTIESLARFYTTFQVDALRAEYPEQFAFLSDEMIEDVGVDLLNPKALSAQGFDMERPFHVGFLSEPSAVVVLIPGEPRALSWVRAKLEDQGVDFTRDEEYAGETIEANEDDEIAVFTHGGYIAVVVTDKGGDGAPAVETARRILDTKGDKAISGSKRYRNVMSKLPGETDVRFYMDYRLQRRMQGLGKSGEELALRGVNPEEMDRTAQALGFDKAYTGAAVKFESDRLNAYTYNWVGKGSPLLDWFNVANDPVPFLRRVPAKPWFLLLMRVNGTAVWKTMSAMVKATPGNANDDVFADADKETGIDIEQDIVDQIDGNVGLTIDQISLMKQDVTLFLQVRDPARMQRTLATLTEHAKEDMAAKASKDPNRPAQDIVEEREGDVAYYRVAAGMSEVCYGVVDDHLVAATGVQRFRDIVAGTGGLAGGAKNDAVRAGLASKSAGVFYVDFQGLSRDAQGFLPMMGPAGVRYGRILSELSELVSVSDVDAEGGSQTLTLTSTSPGVWKRLMAVALENMETE